MTDQTDKRAMDVVDETIDINRCVGSVHVWLSRVDEKSGVRCVCGEFSARDWCNPDVSRVQFRAKKCPNDECIALGACGHHGPGGSCLADGSEHPGLAKHGYASMQQDADEWAVDEDAPTQPVIVTDPGESFTRRLFSTRHGLLFAGHHTSLLACEKLRR